MILSNNFNYPGIAGGGGSNPYTVSTYQEVYLSSIGFTTPGPGSNQYSLPRLGSGIVNVAVRCSVNMLPAFINNRVYITLWQSETNLQTATTSFPTHQRLQFDYDQVQGKFMYRTKAQDNNLATSLRVVYPFYWFTVNQVIDADYDVIICHGIHRNV